MNKSELFKIQATRTYEFYTHVNIMRRKFPEHGFTSANVRALQKISINKIMAGLNGKDEIWAQKSEKRKRILNKLKTRMIEAKIKYEQLGGKYKDE